MVSAKHRSIPSRDTPAYLVFAENVSKVLELDPIPPREYTSLARQAILLKHTLPELRADIAYQMVCVGSKLSSNDMPDSVRTIRDFFMELELPDAHIVTQEAKERGDFSAVGEKWDEIEKQLDLQLLGPKNYAQH